ncbi:MULTISPECIES: DUF411 domain-containing protein [Comamonas]|jgi:hypothetical protein|uniref:Uncharacterized copper-binding protein n=1 Tax=Comamonas aquatica TaxID=225991 RepID=A0AA35D5D4_9BURK|nr:DUF411 domain-containing protein [Comamonas aquatica]MDE1554792.1 DUF411 domain-containing protein [Comamonas aquatica]CAB5666170.1 Uncharacterized copper-binding protein [Comamonas aquatica]CAC9682947.1 Uncharacterized copper-binding protein [Comamonas aquatica]
MHTPTTTRRHALHLLAAAAGLAALPALAASPAKIPMEVWKDPNCGCCKDWIVLMEQAGFAVTVHDSGNSAVRAKLGLPVQYGSCHTALVGGYLVEGHVPAADVHKLLKDKPKALGITVPGMPIGSPGMDGPEYGGRKDPYDVLLVTKSLMGSNVSTRVFTSYR